MTPRLALEPRQLHLLRETIRRSALTAVGDTRSSSVRVNSFGAGPHGCGKTTFAQRRGRVAQASSGTVPCSGRSLGGINTRAGYMFRPSAHALEERQSKMSVGGLEFRGVARERLLTG